MRASSRLFATFDRTFGFFDSFLGIVEAGVPGDSILSPEKSRKLLGGPPRLQKAAKELRKRLIFRLHGFVHAGHHGVDPDRQFDDIMNRLDEKSLAGIRVKRPRCLSARFLLDERRECPFSYSNV